MPGPNFTFCLLAMTGDRMSLVHSFASTLLTVTRSPRLTPAFFRMIPSTRMISIFASSGRLRQYMAAVERFSPLISTISPGFKPRSFSPEIRALPWPTSDGIAFETRNDIIFSSFAIFSLPLLNSRAYLMVGRPALLCSFSPAPF